MTDNNELDALIQLITKIQSDLTELFEEFHELRSRLARITLEESIAPSDDALFSKVTRDNTPRTDETEKVQDEVEEENITSEDAEENSYLDTASSSSETLTEATVSRHLDPIAHEIRTGNAPAEVLAEYLQSAKESLITSENPNSKVARDMDIVLRFLRARGSRGIREEERKNILNRIERWRVHLVSS